jgi:bifunctional non-homologous end joining protein LigD
MPKRNFPDFVPPMMAKIDEQPFDSPDWIFEVKLDGYRGIAVFDATGNRTSGPETDYRSRKSSRRSQRLFPN